jgi:hypothetical protein
MCASTADCRRLKIEQTRPEILVFRTREGRITPGMENDG